MSTRPDPSEYSPYYANYIAHAPDDGDILAILEHQPAELRALLGGLSDAEALAVHPPYTWTIKQVVGHLNDGERVFAYRALRFSRGDATPLPGFDQDPYVAAAPSNRLPLADLLDEFDALRRATLHLLRPLDAAAWSRSGVASDAPVTVKALAYILAGHVNYHAAILRKRLGRA
jgi:hypothetical protein